MLRFIGIILAGLAMVATLCQADGHGAKLDDKNFGAIDATAATKTQDLEISVAIKSNWEDSWRTIKDKDSATSLRVGDFGRFCITSKKNGYAKLWMISPSQKHFVIAPNQYTEGQSWVTKKNDALILEKNQTLCVGEQERGAMRILDQAEEGNYRIVAQIKENRGHLYSEQDLPLLSKSLPPTMDDSESTLLAERSLKAKGGASFVYKVLR